MCAAFGAARKSKGMIAGGVARQSKNLLGAQAITNADKGLGARTIDQAGNTGAAKAAKPTKKKINTGLNIASKY